MRENKMEFEHTIRPIAYIQNDFKEKFGIPHGRAVWRIRRQRSYLSQNTEAAKLCVEWKCTLISGCYGSSRNQ